MPLKKLKNSKFKSQNYGTACGRGVNKDLKFKI